MAKFEVVRLFASDTVGHIFMYGVYTFLLIITVSKKMNVFSFIAIPTIVSIATAFLLGFALELFQSYIPGREFGIDDLIANIFGSVLGLFLFKFFLKFRTSN